MTRPVAGGSPGPPSPPPSRSVGFGAAPWAVLLLLSALGASSGGAPQQFPAQPSTATTRFRLPLGDAILLPRVVDTRYGKLQGLHLSLKENHRHFKNLQVWLGVPYATPPVGGNRFSPTRAPSPWEGVRPATAMGPACPQSPPDISNETASLLRMPRARLHQLKKLLPFTNPQSEDCLYLNIYAPAQEGSDASARKPVLVYIHGESYEWNTGNAYDGSVLAAYADVMVVTVNYRLGILGFLNANPAPGAMARVANYGLMDQLAALHWLQQNAALFGGDPNSVTLMGHGSGAACIQFLMVSPASTPGLFHRAILLSGSALSSWALVEDPVQYAIRLARQVNCTVPTSLLRDHERIVDCLREAPLEALLRADVRPPAFLSAFGPSVDGVVIKHDVMRQLLTAPLAGQERHPRDGFSVFEGYSEDNPGAFSAAAAKLFPAGLGAKGYDLLFGVVTGEALFRFPEKDLKNGFEPERRDRILRTYVRNVYSYHLHEIFSTAVNEYTDWERTELHPINTRDATVSALSDAQFVAPVVQMADLLSAAAAAGAEAHSAGAAGEVGNTGVGAGGIGTEDLSGGDPGEAGGSAHHSSAGESGHRAFFYVFDYQAKDSEYPQRMGAGHGEELPFVWGAPLVVGLNGPFSRNYTKMEVGLSEGLINYWANFIRTGNPNSASNSDVLLPVSREKNRFRTVTWEQYDAGHQKHLEIGTKQVKLKNHFRAHQLSIWLRLIPELHRAGMEDVVGRHNLFRNHHDPGLYDGPVRGAAFNVLTGNVSRRYGNISLPESPTTLQTPVTTCVNVLHYQGRQQPTVFSVNNASAAGDPSTNGESNRAYSTALGVTIAIGCTLLVLNMLIFAGVYYQRDRTRLEVKSLQKQQQQMQGHFGSGKILAGKYPPLGHPGCPSTTVDMDRDQTAIMMSASTPPGAYPAASYGSTSGHPQSMYMATIKEQRCTGENHLPPPPDMYQTSMPPPHQQRMNHTHTATLPRNVNIMNSAETSLSTQPNGAVGVPYYSLPRSGCRRVKSPPDCHRLITTANATTNTSSGGGTATTISSVSSAPSGVAVSTALGVPAAALSEMRV